jgi:hypothetical protein
VAVASALALGALVSGFGCQTTTSTCSGGLCQASLEGGGASVELETPSVTLTLEEAADGVARLTANGAELECATGDTARVPSATVMCDAVGEDNVDVTVSAR